MAKKKSENGVRFFPPGVQPSETAPPNGCTNNLVEKEELLRLANERLAALPDSRPQKIKEAKEKIARGFYEKPEVVEKAADRFLEEMGIG